MCVVCLDLVCCFRLLVCCCVCLRAVWARWVFVFGWVESCRLRLRLCLFACRWLWLVVWVSFSFLLWGGWCLLDTVTLLFVCLLWFAVMDCVNSVGICISLLCYVCFCCVDYNCDAVYLLMVFDGVCCLSCLFVT